ncbi:hypothetical protein IAT38_007124 [Cryptococcus sp. DSM 104549]
MSSQQQQLPETMDAIVYKAPHKVVLEKVPTPKLLSDGDAIIKVHLAGLCGSDLHVYRGREAGPTGFSMGHEVVGTLIQKGSAVTEYEVGDVVAVPFTVSCGSCYYCDAGHTSRCASSALFGSPKLAGCQASYVRVPLAQACLMRKPEGLAEELMLLMADILPTGYSAAWNAWRLLDTGGERGGKGEKRGVCVVVGCGPVGLCAITSSLTLFATTLAIDPNPTRRQLAEKHGAKAYTPDEIRAAVLAATEGRGADAVLEVVGNEGALRAAMDLVRPYGAISSVGVHAGEMKLNGAMLYDKNIKFQFGRCSVRTFYSAALEVLMANQELFKGFIEHKVGFSQAEEYYELFEQNKIAKTVFVPGE